MSYADLHVHTIYSDGTYTPTELMRAAKRENLAAIAVTDHDTLDAIPDCIRAAAEAGIEFIPGVEITCSVNAQEIHLLAYFFGDAWRDRDLHAVLEHSKRVRERRVEEFVAKLNSLGIGLTVDDVHACSEHGTIGRPHVAQALVRRGFTKNQEESFDRFLRRGKPAYVERYRMEAAEAIGHVKRAGGVAVLAHPALNRVDEQIPHMVSQGLDGLEVWHSRHSQPQTNRYLRLTEELGLLATGGSDCHGESRGKGEALLGAIKLPYERVEALKERARRIR
jgi:predicted metal-dependent phosphoesterase TrpH